MSKGTTKIKQTADEKRYYGLLEDLTGLVNEKIEDIETGIEEGIYEDDKDNEKELARLNKILATIDEERADSPKVYVFIEGGMIQGVSASRSIEWNQYDKDCEDDDDQYVEDNGTSDEWDAEVERLTKEGIIRPFI